MRWPVFAIFAFFTVVAQLSLANVFALSSLGHIVPDLVACLAVFVGLFAPRMTVLWVCWVLGLAMDLAPAAGGGAPILGPHALGYVFAGYVVLQLRTMVFRRRPLTMGFLTFVCVLAAGVVVVSVLTVRSWYPADPALPNGPLEEMARRLGIALYSALIAIPLGWLLCSTIPLWGFHTYKRAAS
jgi:rod shape-determining protein MreD